MFAPGRFSRDERGAFYFGARYFDPFKPRFMSVDWADKPEAVPYSDLADPQSLILSSLDRITVAAKILRSSARSCDEWVHLCPQQPVSRTDADGHGWFSDLGQKLHNKLKYGYFVIKSQLESALQKDAEIMRKQLHDQGVSKSGVSADDALRGKSNQEVADYYWQYRTAAELGRVRENGVLPFMTQ